MSDRQFLRRIRVVGLMAILLGLAGTSLAAYVGFANSEHAWTAPMAAMFGGVAGLGIGIVITVTSSLRR